MNALMRILLLSLLFLIGCAELKDEFPAPVVPGLQVHPDGWAAPESEEFHGAAVRALGWDMSTCRSCHGAMYDGGTVEVSCRKCHDQDGGPEHCATCHGGNNPAPPRGVSDEESSTEVAVGAHQPHFKGASCSWCHNVPPSVYTTGHVDSDLPAEVPLTGWLARADSSVNTPLPAYDYGSSTCSNVYCHGNWTLHVNESRFPGLFTDSVMTGANFSPAWTGGLTEAECGTCHGLPPPGHLTYQLSQCGACHNMIVGSSGDIIDPGKHINGRINVFGTERDF